MDTADRFAIGIELMSFKFGEHLCFLSNKRSVHSSERIQLSFLNRLSLQLRHQIVVPAGSLLDCQLIKVESSPRIRKSFPQ